MRVLPFIFAALLAPGIAGADDGAASVAAGGIVVMRREPSIVVAKEILTISASTVAVEYGFRNDSDADVTTEIAFPIPAYGWVYERALPGSLGFDEFKLWVDGKPTPFLIQAKALIGTEDLTAVLRSLHVDPASFGHYHDSTRGPVFSDIRRLTASDRGRLVALKLIDPDGTYPLWQVQK
jgi:hypothetical protein